LGMFVITEADADAIRAVFSQEESCRPLSSCAGGFQGSPTTRKRVRALGASLGGRRCQSRCAR
jgi:hypothetical protein